MPDIIKPDNLSLTWASSGDILNPGDTKIATGWAVEIPPRQWFNYLDNRQDEAIAHINQRGIAEWDTNTEYQGIKSYTQGSNGTIYRSKQTNSSQDPVLDVAETYWEIAFASAGDFYTKAEADGKYLIKSNNLSDLPNTATARFWLDVYSKSETYTKTEVNNKTTVASASQAQQGASNTTLITPLRLKESFGGANQLLTDRGYQVIPGGLIIQWYKGELVNNKAPFPIPFTDSVFVVIPTDNLSNNPVAWDSSLTTLSQAHIISSTTTETVSFIAIGK